MTASSACGTLRGPIFMRFRPGISGLRPHKVRASKDWNELRRFDHTKGLWSVDYSPNGSYAVTAGGLDGKGRVVLWDVAQGKELRQFEGHQAGVWQAIFMPDSRYVLSASIDLTMRLWEVETGK